MDPTVTHHPKGLAELEYDKFCLEDKVKGELLFMHYRHNSCLAEDWGELSLSVKSSWVRTSVDYERSILFSQAR